MQIPMEMLNKWKGLRSRGDNKRINLLFEKPLEANNLIATIARAFNRGYAPDHVFKAMNQFYTAKEAELFPPAKPTSHE
jgi:hypothetical protein